MEYADVMRWRRALQTVRPADPGLARRMDREAAASRQRRAERAQREQLIQESRALCAAAELRLEARDTVQGQLIAAFRRGR